MPTEVHAYHKSKDQININKIMQQIVLRRHGPKLGKKLQEKFKWDDRVFELIDWETHRVAVSETPKM